MIKCRILTSRISLLSATSSGDSPSLFFENREGFWRSRNLKQSMCPYSEQKWLGVLPSTSLALMSASLRIRVWITPSFPLMQATCKGVLKFCERESFYAPYSMKASIKSTWPSLDATCRGDQPSLLDWLTRALLRRDS